MGAENIEQIGRRRDSRLRVEVPAKLELLTGRHQVSLLDLSQSGARCRTDDDIKLGQEGFLTWLDFETFGKIVWSKFGLIGIEFDQILPTGTLLQTRDRFDHHAYRDEKQKARDNAREAARNWSQGFKR